MENVTLHDITIILLVLLCCTSCLTHWQCAMWDQWDSGMTTLPWLADELTGWVSKKICVQIFTQRGLCKIVLRHQISHSLSPKTAHHCRAHVDDNEFWNVWWEAEIKELWAKLQTTSYEIKINFFKKNITVWKLM